MTNEATSPRPYDLSDATERDRLLRETLGYARVSLDERNGTDLAGREFAHSALKMAMALGYRLVGPEG